MSKRRELVGTVIPSKMDKTVVVEIARKFPHPKYKKYVSKTKKYYAHNVDVECNAGDLVRIIESKPLSKLKRWRVLGIEKALGK
tara:strand:+ start:3377 stop:3628 length:252 start_codon:yes stop_codon:yes gene_type:complete